MDMFDIFLDRLVRASLELAVVTVFVMAFLRIAGRRSFRFHCLVWMIVLIKPLFTLLVGTPVNISNIRRPDLFSKRLILRKDTGRDPSYSRPASDSPDGRDPETSKSPVGNTDPVYRIEPEESGRGITGETKPLSSGGSVTLFRLPPFSRLIFYLWSFGVLSFLVIFIRGQRKLRGIVERAGPFRTPRIGQLLEEHCELLRITPPPLVRVSVEITSPALVGFLRPVIMIPSWLDEEGDEEKIGWVLRHELSHLSGKDPLWLFFRRLTLTLFFFHPMAWYASKKWEETMEQACDRVMIKTGEQADHYAETLYLLIKRIREDRQARGAEGLFATRTRIGKRIAAILQGGMKTPARMGLAEGVLTMLLALFILLAGFHFSVAGERPPSRILDPPSRIPSKPPVVKVVYVVPSDRNPHEDYGERLDCLFHMIRNFFRRQMAAGGYVDSSGEGKTFQLEEASGGRLKVHLLDHGPDGNHPDELKTTALYRSNLGEAVGRDFRDHLPPDFAGDALVVTIVDMAEIDEDHMIASAACSGSGRPGPGETGYVYFSDHIFGNDLEIPGEFPPLVFHAIGRNRKEQSEIFRDVRFTNTIELGPPYARGGEPDSWREGELPHPQNIRVWEYASVQTGAMAQALGSAFGLDRCLRLSYSPEADTFGDFNLMYNGYRPFFAAVFPERDLVWEDLYPRSSKKLPLFGARTIINPLQLPGLDRNWFFNPEKEFSDFSPPRVKDLRADWDPGEKRIRVSFSAGDNLDKNPSGLSHVNLFLDWKLHQCYKVDPRYEREDVFAELFLDLTPEEYEREWFVNDTFPTGVHAVMAEAVDRDGNASQLRDAAVYFSIGQDRVSDWLIWSEYFDGRRIVAWNAPVRRMLRHSYFDSPDAGLIPREGDGTGGHVWRIFHTGDYVDVTGRSREFFKNATGRTDRRLCYAAVYLVSDREREINLRVGYGDYIQVFLNGEEVYADVRFDRAPHPFHRHEQVSMRIDLLKGRNLLLVKSYNHGGDGGFHVWFDDPSGDSLPLEPWPPEDPSTLSYRLD